jgi:hypothetical protein
MKMKRGVASAAALILMAAWPAFAGEQISFKLLGGLARIQGDDYNAGILGAYELARDTSDSVSGSYEKLGNGWIFQGEIVNSWGPHFGVGLGGGYYRMSNTAGISGVASVPDPSYTFASTYAPKVSVIPLFLNVHYLTGITPAVSLDLFAGPVFEIVQFGFARNATSSLDSLSETETFNASGTALGFQGGLDVGFRVVRGVTLVAEGLYRAAKLTDLSGNWFLTSTTSSGTVTQSNSSYYLWSYDYTAGGVYHRIGFFDSNGPSGDGISGARKARLNLSGLVALVGVRFSI